MSILHALLFYLYSVLKFQPEWGVYSFCISPLFLSLRCEQCANSGCVWPTWFIWYWSFIYWNYCSRSSSHPSHLVLVSWEKRIAIGGGGYHSCGSVHVYGPFIFLPEIYFGSTILDIYSSSSSSLMLKAVNKLYFGFIYTWDIFFLLLFQLLVKVVHSLWSSYIFHVDRLLMVVANWAHISTELLCLPFSSIFFLKMGIYISLSSRSCVFLELVIIFTYCPLIGALYYLANKL